MLKRLYLIRHAQTDYTKDELIQGWIDRPLNSFGKIQANLLAKSLADEPIDAIYSSDLKRAYQTAHFLAKLKNIKPIKSAKIKERNLGILQGKSWKEVKHKHRDLLNKLDDTGKLDWKGHQGETLRHLNHRVSQFIKQLEKKHPNQNVAIFAHGGSIRAILATLGFRSESENVFIHHASVTIIDKNSHGKYKITQYNKPL